MEGASKGARRKNDETRLPANMRACGKVRARDLARLNQGHNLRAGTLLCLDRHVDPRAMDSDDEFDDARLGFNVSEDDKGTPSAGPRLEGT